jgi:hypothetical protein
MDGTKIIPKKGLGIIFSNLDAHMLTKYQGNRLVTLVKIY